MTTRYFLHLTMAVPLFYLLSAYTLCLSSYKRSDENITSFYIRRFFRIAPLFYFMTLLYIVGRYVSGRNVPLNTILTNVFFIFNFIPQSNQFEGIVTASWSIGVEMPFYLLFPFLLRASRGITRATLLFVIALIVSFLFRSGLHWITLNGIAQKMNLSSETIQIYSVLSLITNIPYFMMGIITFHIHKIIIKYEKRRLISTMLLILTITAFAGLPYMSDQYVLNPVPVGYLISLFFMTLILSLFMKKNGLIINKFTVFFGEISYSSYLVHGMVIGVMVHFYDKIIFLVKLNWLAFIVCFAVTVLAVILVSLLTYKLIELPGMRLGHIFDKRLRAIYPSAFHAYFPISKPNKLENDTIPNNLMS